jgi:hypothetical protein
MVIPVLLSSISLPSPLKIPLMEMARKHPEGYVAHQLLATSPLLNQLNIDHSESFGDFDAGHLN